MTNEKTPAPQRQVQNPLVEAYCHSCGRPLGSFASIKEYTAWRNSHNKCECGSPLDKSLTTKWPIAEGGETCK